MEKIYVYSTPSKNPICHPIIAGGVKNIANNLAEPKLEFYVVYC